MTLPWHCIYSADMTKKRPPKTKKGPTRMTSIRLDPDLVAKLQKRAEALGIGWQTLIKMILNRYGDGEL